MHTTAKIHRLFVPAWIGIGGLLLILLSLHASPPAGAATAADFCFNASPGTVPKPALTLQLIEGSPTPQTFTVQLCSQPDSQVSFVTHIWDSQNRPDNEHFIVEPVAFSIADENWDQLQTITVTMQVDDQQYEPPAPYTIYFEATSSDTDFQWQPPQGEWVRGTITDNDQALSYFPIIAHTVPQPPAWHHFTTTQGLNLDVVRLHQNRIFLGERSDSRQKGIYVGPLSNCSADATFNHLNDQAPIRDLFFRGDRGLAASFGGKVFYSSDIMNVWQPTTSNMNRFVYGVVKATNNRSYAGTDVGLYVSDNDGATWQIITPASGTNPQIVNAFAYRDSEGDFLWVATFGNGVSRYQISSNSVVLYANGLPTPTAKQVLDVTLRNSNEIYIGTIDGVYKGATNTSRAWVDFGLRNLQVVSLELVDNTLYAGTNKQGIYTRDLNGSADWMQQTTPLNGNVIRDLLYNTTEFCKNKTENRNGLLAATDNGLWVYR